MFKRKTKSLPSPVIVLPGITASNLRDEYPTDPESVWSAVMKKEYERLTLHPDDRRYELRGPSRVQPDGVFGYPYGELIEELRYNLADRPDRPVPVFPFAYDWRQPLAATELQLAAFIEEVVDRTCLLKHYHADGYIERRSVSLVGHSMGGLIIAGYLQGRAGEQESVEAEKVVRIDKVATLGTPYRGSFESILKIVTGTADIEGHIDRARGSRERESARLMPALYHLLPRFPDGHSDPDSEAGFDTSAWASDESFNIFEARCWQRGVIETLATFIEMHGLEKLKKSERQVRAVQLLQDILREAEVHRDRIESLDLNEAGLKAADFLCIAGVDTTTRVRLTVSCSSKGKRQYFDLTSDDRMNKYETYEKFLRLGGQGEDWTGAVPGVLTGDGTVPYLGALPAFLPREQVVCVRPRDFGYWEWGERLANGKVGFHGMLPQLNLVHRLIVKHLRGQRGDRSVWGWPGPNVAKGFWQPPIPHLAVKDSS